MSATHPALELFRNDPLGGLAVARFPRWWKIDVSGKNAAGERVATLKSPTAEYSFLAERRYKAGRVLLCSVPLDSSWGTNLTDLPAFVPLAHELVYYLAGARSAEFNLQPGQPIRYRLTSNAPPDGFRLQPPLERKSRWILARRRRARFPAHVTAPPRAGTLVCDETRETGVYRLKTPEDQHRLLRRPVRPARVGLDRLHGRGARPRGQNPADAVPERPQRDPGARNPGEQRQDWWWVLLLGHGRFYCAARCG